jgi:glucose-6-phosphate 1-dehydrogenase
MTHTQRQAIAQLVYSALMASDRETFEPLSKQLKKDALNLMFVFAMSFSEYKELTSEYSKP